MSGNESKLSKREEKKYPVEDYFPRLNYPLSKDLTSTNNRLSRDTKKLPVIKIGKDSRTQHVDSRTQHQDSRIQHPDTNEDSSFCKKNEMKISSESSTVKKIHPTQKMTLDKSRNASYQRHDVVKRSQSCTSQQRKTNIAKLDDDVTRTPHKVESGRARDRFSVPDRTQESKANSNVEKSQISVKYHPKMTPGVPHYAHPDTSKLLNILASSQDFVRLTSSVIRSKTESCLNSNRQSTDQRRFVKSSASPRSKVEEAPSQTRHLEGRYRNLVETYLDLDWRRARKLRLMRSASRIKSRYREEKLRENKKRTEQMEESMKRQRDQLEHVRNKHFTAKQKRVSSQHVKWKFIKEELDDSSKYGLPRPV